MAQIDLSDIRKQFGETKVLNGIDLTIHDGEFLTLVGPSGCGKSTLLRIIAGLEAQTNGDVRIGERLVNGVRASERDLAMVFQSYALYPHLTVRENMLTPLRLRDLTILQRLPFIGRFMPGMKDTLSSLQQTVDETAEVLKIEQLLDRKPGQLSGGQRQRAALGRAMVRRPVAFLMDEPLSNLDAALRVHMRAELTELHQRLNTTFIYVTHDQAEALTMSTRVAVMMHGDILQLDTPARIYADPATREVAEFVGSPKINILDGRINEDGRVDMMGTSLRRHCDSPAGQVQIGLRPEHLSIVSNEDTVAGAFDATIRYVENLGSDVFVHATLADGRKSIIVRTEPTVLPTLENGSKISVSADPGSALLFGMDGNRLRFTEEEGISSTSREVA